MKPDISTFRFMAGVALAAMLQLHAAHAQRMEPPSVIVDIPVDAYPLTGKTNGGSESRTVLLVNLAALRRVVFRPEDVLEASVQISLQHAPAGGSLSVYGKRPSAPATPFTLNHFELESVVTLQAREFHPDPNLSTAVRVAEVKGIGERLRAGLVTSEADMPFLVVASPGFAQLNIAGIMAHVTIVSHPKAVLFSPPVQPRTGVYVEDRDGHLFYGGQRLRLWGCVRPQLPNAETADRIANMGFNAIRMWGPRAADLPDGHSPLIDDRSGEFMAPSRGDGSPLDEYDRFYAEAKRAGLFIMATGLTDNAHVSAKSRWLEGSGEHWKQWQEAMASKPDAWILNFMAAVDGRLLQAREKQAKDYLTHVNPYTGKAYAEEEAIAIFELENENAHVKRTLEKGFDKWPPFFVSELQQRWNEWLIARYHDDAALTRSWSKIDAGETLHGGTIKLEPLAVDKDRYPVQRASDFIRFLIEIDNALNERLMKYARSFAPKGVGVAVIPFSYDTQYMPSSGWLFDNTETGDVANFGMYFWSLQNPLTKPPAMYVMDSNTVEGKITAIYETMDGRPDPYRAAYPYRLAALASWEDWDAIFFHYWEGFQKKGETVPDEAYMAAPLSYIAPTHYWTSVYYDKDPVLLSTMALAGQMFIRGAINPAPHPTTYVLGAKSIFDMSALGGADLGKVTYSQGARIRFAPDSDTGVTVQGGASQKTRGRSSALAIAMGDQVLWDWPNGRLIIDTPTAKAYVGAPHGNYRFNDGTSVGGFDGSFVSFAIVSADGRPLTGKDMTREVYMAAVNDAKNTGYHIRFNEKTDPTPSGGPLGIGKLIDNNGTAPVVVDHAPFHFWFPRDLSGILTGYDLARRARFERKVNGGLLEHSGSEMFLAALRITNMGAKSIVTPQTTPIEVPSQDAEEDASPVPRASAGPAFTGIWNPLPGVVWSDAPEDIKRKLEETGAHVDAVTVSARQVHLGNSDALFKSASDIDLIYKDGRMNEIRATFTQPPVLAAIIADYDKQLGSAVEKHLAASEDQVSTVTWLRRYGALTLTVKLTETQGVLSVACTLMP